MLCEKFRGTFAVDGSEFRFVIVIADLQTGRLELLGSSVQGVGDRKPAVGAGLGFGAGNDHIFAAQRQIKVARALNFCGVEVIKVVVGRKAAHSRLSSSLRMSFVWASLRSK